MLLPNVASRQARSPPGAKACSHRLSCPQRVSTRFVYQATNSFVAVADGARLLDYFLELYIRARTCQLIRNGHTTSTELDHSFIRFPFVDLDPLPIHSAAALR